MAHKYGKSKKRQICQEYADADVGQKQQVLERYGVARQTLYLWTRSLGIPTNERMGSRPEQRNRFTDDQKREICKEYSNTDHGAKASVLERYKVGSSTVWRWLKDFGPGPVTPTYVEASQYTVPERRQICKEYAQAPHGSKKKVLEKYRVYAATVKTWSRYFEKKGNLLAARDRYAVVLTPEQPAPGVSVEQLIRILSDLEIEEATTDRILGRVTKILHG